MKTKNLVLMGGLVAGLIAFIPLTGCKSVEIEKGSAGPASETASGTVTKGTTTKGEFLFVQSAASVTFESENVMTLHAVSPMTTCFADWPERIAGHMPTSRIVPMWNEGKKSFLAEPPNATLSVITADSVSNIIVELRNPRIYGGDICYDVRVIKGRAPTESGSCSLFIDIVGMPVTPMSNVGAEQKAGHRSYVYGGVYGPALVAPCADRYPYPSVASAAK